MIKAYLPFLLLCLTACGSDQTKLQENSAINDPAKKEQIVLIDSTQQVYHVYDLTEALAQHPEQLIAQLKDKEIYIKGKVSEVNNDVVFFYDIKFKKGIVVHCKDPGLKNTVNNFDQVILKGRVERINESNVTLMEGMQAMYR